MSHIIYGFKDNLQKCNFSATDQLSVKNNTDNNPINDKEFFSLITNFIEPGNVIPNFWYKKITDSKGNPDLTSITILSEIIALYRLILKDKFPIGTFMDADQQPILVGTSLRTSYENFSNKFCLSKEKVRRALIRLEELNIIERGVSNVALSDGSRCNKLIITVNHNFLKSCFRDPNIDIRAQRDESGIFGNKIIEKTDFSKIQSLQISNDHYISNKNNIKNKENRSIASNIFKNDFEDKNSLKVNADNILTEVEEIETDKKTSPDNTKAVEKPKNLITRDYFPQAKKLAEFYPLSADDCNKLQSSSKRKFCLVAMNEILKDMSKRLSDRFFHSKKGFMAYMTKVFANEMRDPVKIDNKDFRIKSNITEEEKKANEIEKYLAEIEDTRQVSPEWHLKKKLACRLKRETAYEVIRNYRRMDIENGKAVLELHKYTELQPHEKEIILAQVKASHEGLNNEGIYFEIFKLEIIMPAKRTENISREETKKIKEKEAIKRVGTWGKIRQVMVEYFNNHYKDGEGIDESWFSKLEAEIDEEKKQITLKAPSSLYVDYIYENYMGYVEDAVKSVGFEFKDICKTIYY